jgi:hypothetical protein
MEHPRIPDKDIDPNTALFIADSIEVRERLDALNQRLMATLKTIPKPWLISLGWGKELAQPQNSSWKQNSQTQQSDHD